MRMGIRAEWRRAVGLVGVLLLLQLGGESVRGALRFERDAIAAGELWRLWTAHFVHLGWNHAWLNCAGVLLCCLLAPSASTAACGCAWPAGAGRRAVPVVAVARGA